MNNILNQTEKIDFLDGIRGIMACNVIICHFICAFYPQMYSQGEAEKLGVCGGGLAAFAVTPLSVLVNGAVGVQYFFVLTGFLVGRNILLRDLSKEAIGLKLVNRYLRLLPMIVLATVFTYLTMVWGWQMHLLVSGNTLCPDFYNRFCNFVPTIKHLLFHCFWMPFISHSDFVGPFWTIKYEFWGYCICLLLCWFFRSSRFRRLALLVSFGITYLCVVKLPIFFLGALVADLYYDRRDNAGFLSKVYNKFIYRKSFLIIVFIIGIYFVCCPLSFTTTHTWLKYPCIFNIHLRPDIVQAWGWACIIFSLLFMPRLQRLFEAEYLQKLGRLSFAIYSFHWPVMLVVLAGLFRILYPKTSYNVAALVAFAASLPVIFLISWAVSPIEEKIRKTITIKRSF